MHGRVRIFLIIVFSLQLNFNSREHEKNSAEYWMDMDVEKDKNDE